MYTRANAVMTIAVDEGITRDRKNGAAIAWAYMKHCNVPQEVILRVLADPHLRRRTYLNVPAAAEGGLDENGELKLWRATTPET